MHLLAGFFDYFLCDGSHGFSKYGWKFIPMCIISSGGKTVPIGAVFGLEEDRQSLDELLALFRQHCEQHGVDCPQFQLRNDEGKSYFVLVYTLTPRSDALPERLIPDTVLSWNRENLRNFLYPPEYEIFMHMLHATKANDDDLVAAFPAPPAVIQATLHSDAGPAFVGLTR